MLDQKVRFKWRWVRFAPNFVSLVFEDMLFQILRAAFGTNDDPYLLFPGFHERVLMINHGA
jgi:hypothetical protein